MLPAPSAVPLAVLAILVRLVNIILVGTLAKGPSTLAARAQNFEWPLHWQRK